MSDPVPATVPAGSPSAVALGAWLAEGLRGVAEVRAAAGGCRLHLADGTLRLANDDPLDRGGAAANTAVPPADLEPLIVLLASATAENVRFTATTVSAPQGRVLPTARLLMEAAVRGRDRGQLWSQIGGRSVTLRMAGGSRLSEEALGVIDARQQSLLARFVKARHAAELVGDGTDAHETLRDLARLRVGGLLAPAVSDPTQTSLSDHSKELFVRRISRELERRPLRINSDDHRRQVVDLVRNLGERNHYELLRVGRHQDEQAIHQAYVEMASLAHPSHAAKLRLEGRSAALDLLFEAVTEAYLVLSHPDRRRDYDRDLGTEVGAPASETRRREKASVARDMYNRARRMAVEQDLQNVLELMQQAVQLDPQAEYYKLLGDVQRRNPQWKTGALASYRDAVRCRPDDPDLRLAFARALEEGNDRDQAGIQYRAALELRPNDPLLQEALDQFETVPSGKTKSKGLFRRGGDSGAKSGEKGGEKAAAKGREKTEGKGREKKKEGKEGDDGGGGMFPTFTKLFRRGK